MVTRFTYEGMSGEVATAATGAPKPPPDPFYTLRPHAGDVVAVQYLNLGSNGGIVSGTGSGQLSLWSLSTKRQTWTETCPASVVSISRVTRDTLAVQLSGGTVTLWSLEAHKQVSSFSIPNPSFCRLSPFPHAVDSSALLNPNCFAVADANWGKANIYDSSTQKLVQTLSVRDPKSKGMCMCIQTHCNQSTGTPCVFGGFDDGSIILWDCRQPSTELTSLKLFLDPVMCMSFDAESQSGVCGSPTNTLEVFTLSAEQALLQKKYTVELKNPGVGDVSVRQDNKIMASGGWDGRIRVFGWKKGKPLAILNYHSAAVHCVSFAGSSALPIHANLLICGSKDERISLWTLY